MNNTLTVAVIDDELHAREKILLFLKEQAEHLSIDEFVSADEALPELRKKKHDIIFLDVQMPGTSGITLLSLLKEYRPYIIFTTAYPEYALTAFEYDAVHYLLKPFDYSMFVTAFSRAKERLTADRQSAALQTIQQTGLFFAQPKGTTIAVKENGKHILLNSKDILYIESNHNNLSLVTATRSYQMRETLGNIQERLQESGLIRIHKGYLVQHNEVASLESLLNGEYILTLKNGKKLPTGRTYKEIVEKTFLGKNGK